MIKPKFDWKKINEIKRGYDEKKKKFLIIYKLVNRTEDFEEFDVQSHRDSRFNMLFQQSQNFLA